MNTFKKNQIIITALAIMIAIAGYLNFTNKANPKEDQYVFNNESNDVVAELDATGLVPNDDSLLNVDVIEEPDATEANATPDAANDAAAIDQTTADGTVVDEPAADEQATADDAVVEDADLVAEANDSANAEDVGEAVFVSSTSVESGYFLNAKIEREQLRASSIDILFGIIDNENMSEEQKVDAAAQLIQLQDTMEKEASAESILEAKGYSDVFVRMNKEDVDVVVNIEKLTETDLAQIADVVSRKTGFDPSQIVISPLQVQK